MRTAVEDCLMTALEKGNRRGQLQKTAWRTAVEDCKMTASQRTGLPCCWTDYVVYWLLEGFRWNAAKVPDRARNLSLKLGLEQRLGVLNSGSLFSSSKESIFSRTGWVLEVLGESPRLTQDCIPRDRGVIRRLGVPVELKSTSPESKLRDMSAKTSEPSFSIRRSRSPSDGVVWW